LKANALAEASPNPEVAPVTIAVLPVKSGRSESEKGIFGFDCGKSFTNETIDTTHCFL